MGELHSDFALPIVINHNVVSDLAPATPEKVKDKWSSLVHELKRKIERWEMSGQGDGGRDKDRLDCWEDDDDANELSTQESRPKPAFGELSNCPHKALDLRLAFFRDKESYLLYLWEALDNNNLMVSSMQRLDNSVAAMNGADGILSVLGNKRKFDESSSMTTSWGESNKDNYKSTKKIEQLSKTIH